MGRGTENYNFSKLRYFFSSICVQLRASGIVGSLYSIPKFLSKGLGVFVIYELGTEKYYELTFCGRKSINLHKMDKHSHLIRIGFQSKCLLKPEHHDSDFYFR